MTRISQLYIYQRLFPISFYNTFSDAFYFYDIQDSIYNTSGTLLFSIANEITYYLIIINSLHAVYNLFWSLPLAHKCMYLTSYMFYTVSVWTCLQHISLYELYYAYALYSLYVGLSLAHTQMTHLCIIIYAFYNLFS